MRKSNCWLSDDIDEKNTDACAKLYETVKTFQSTQPISRGRSPDKSIQYSRVGLNIRLNINKCSFYTVVVSHLPINRSLLKHISLLFTVCDSVWFHCCPGWNDRVYMRSLAARRNYHLQSGFIATYFSICVSALFYVATSHLSTETFKKYIHLMT